MATKAQEMTNLTTGAGCLGKAALDEPLFILRAQDALAPDLVRRWARLAASVLGPDHAKVREAEKLANDMEVWQDKTGRAKMPD